MKKKISRAPEICELERSEALVDEDVIRLDVGMHQVPRRHVLQSGHELFAILLDCMHVDSRLS